MNFFTFFAVKLKLYYNGYNMLVGYDVYTISDIIWNDWNGEWAGGTPKCAMHIKY